MSNTKEYFHYDMCGLDYIYLANGYTVYDTPYGSGISIDNSDELHRAIGLHIALNLKAIRGQEIRFFRSELKLSQYQMAQMFGTTLRTYQKWESDKLKPVNPQADRLMRIIFLEYLGKTTLYKEVSDRLSKLQTIKNEIDEELKLAETSKGWKVAA